MTSSSSLPSTTLEPGDRFEAGLDLDGRNLTLPDSLLELDQSIDRLIGPDGQPLSFQLADSYDSLELAEPLSPAPGNGNSLWLEFQEQGQFQLIVQKEAASASALPSESAFQLTLNSNDDAFLRAAPQEHATLSLFALARAAAQLSTNAGFDRLICLPLVRDMELLDHQIRTAKTVLQRFRGKALLCDEVG